MNSIIFLPGFLGVKEDWREVQTHLSDYETIALDLPPTNVLKTLAQTIRSLSQKPPIVVGYSMGGRLALQLQQSENYEKVIVLSAHPGISSEQERKEVLSRDERWARLLETVSLEEFLERWYENPLFATLKARAESFEKMLSRRRKNDPKVCAFQLRSCSGGHFLPLNLPASTAFLYGELDCKYAKLYQSLPSHVTVKMIPGCGHVAHLEDPAACAEKIRELLRAFKI